MGSETDPNPWLGCVRRNKGLLEEAGCKVPFRVCSEADFRDAFEKACKQSREYRPHKWLNNIARYYSHITAFASAIDKTFRLTNPDSLTAVFWTGGITVVQYGFKAKMKAEDIANLLQWVNGAMPHMGGGISRFPNETEVQGPLESIFDEYLGIYKFIINCCSEQDATPSDIKNKVEDRVKQAEVSLLEKKKLYQEMVDKAAKDEEARKMIEVPNGEGIYSTTETESRYHFRRRLGRGSYAEVYELQETKTKQVFACKCIPYKHDTQDAKRIEDEVINEVQIGWRLRHQHITSMLFYNKGADAYGIFMLPVADYDLAHFLNYKCVAAGYPEGNLRAIYPWFGCLSDALAYAHGQEVKHQDIKPSNILIKDWQPYLADFGAAKDFADDGGSVSREEFVRGTLVYRAPESDPLKPYSRPVDVFALGCVFTEMMTVTQRRSLDEFREYRKNVVAVPSEMYAYRRNLGKVKDWLDSLRDNAEDTGLVKVLHDQTLSMLRERPKGPTGRPTAQDCVYNLKRHRALICAAHP